jgi:hypothetical protein
MAACVTYGQQALTAREAEPRCGWILLLAALTAHRHGLYAFAESILVDAAPPPPLPGLPPAPRSRGAPLRRFLVAEVLMRWCDWLVREFVVLYLLLIRGVDAAVVGLQPFIGLTFIFLVLFPLSLALAPDGCGLIVVDLREIGEPACLGAGA